MEDINDRVICQSIFHKHLILEAGAGTGKTATLVARILCWSIGPGWEKAARLYDSRNQNLASLQRTSIEKGNSSTPETSSRTERKEEQRRVIESARNTAIASLLVRRVVAITFTEAAAAEMSERVAEGLLRLSNGDLSIVGMYPQLLLNYISGVVSNDTIGNQESTNLEHVFPLDIDQSYGGLRDYIQEVFDGTSLSAEDRSLQILDLYEDQKSSISYDEIDIRVVSCIKERAQYLRSVSDQFIVRTIHAYCRRILSQFPLEGQIHPKFQVDPDGKKIRDCVIRVLLIEIEKIFSKVDDQFERYKEFFDYKRTIEDITETIISMLGDGVKHQHFEHFSRDVLFCEYPHLINDLDQICRILRQIINFDAKQKKVQSIVDVLEELHQILQRGNQLQITDENIRQHEKELIAWSELYKEQKISSTISKWQKGDFTAGIQKFFDSQPNLKDQVVMLSQRLGKSLSSLKHFKPRLIQLTHQIVLPLFTLCEKEKRRLGLLTFSELLTETTELLEEQPYIRSQIQNSIDLLLVDEFQDTSAVQCRLVEQIANLNTDTNKHTPILFIVGDPKQSIYGWRNADISAYFEFCKKVSKSQLGFDTRLHLTCNFRSRPVILDEVAACMRGVMEEEDGFQPPFAALHPMRNPQIWDGFIDYLTELKPQNNQTPLQQRVQTLFSSYVNLKCKSSNLSSSYFSENRDESGVQHWITWAFDDNLDLILDARNQPLRIVCQELEAKFVVDDIITQQKKHNKPWSSFAVLVRKMTDIDDILNEMRRRNVPYMVSNDRNYYRRREIIEVVSMLRIVFDPSDILSLIAFLRSAHVGLPDFAFLSLWQLGFPSFFQNATGTDEDSHQWTVMFQKIQQWDFALEDIPRASKLKNWKTRLDDQVRHLLYLRRCLRETSVEEFVVIVKRSSLFSLTEGCGYQGVYRLANIDKLMNQLREAMIEDDGDWLGVLETLKVATKEVEQSREARPKEAGENAVQILSIHKSKGLDFDSVYLLQIHKSMRGANDLPTFVNSPTSWCLMDTMTLSAIQYLQKQELVAKYENVRLLYVAMTRAKNRLIVSGVHPLPSSSGVQYKEKNVTFADGFLDLLSRRYIVGFDGENPLDVCLPSDGPQKSDFIVPVDNGSLPKKMMGVLSESMLQEFSNSKIMTTVMVGLLSSDVQRSFTEVQLPHISRIQSEAKKFRQRSLEANFQSQRPTSEHVTHIGYLMPQESELTLTSLGYKRLIALSLHAALARLCSLLWIRRRKTIDWREQKFIGQRILQNMSLGKASLDTQDMWLRLVGKLPANLQEFPSRNLVGYHIPLRIPAVKDGSSTGQVVVSRSETVQDVSSRGLLNSVCFDDYRIDLLFESEASFDEETDQVVRELVVVELSMAENTKEILEMTTTKEILENSPLWRSARILEQESKRTVKAEVWSLFTGEVFEVL